MPWRGPSPRSLKIAAIGIAIAIHLALLAAPVALLFLLAAGAALLVLAAIGALFGLAVALVLGPVGHWLAP